MYITYVASSYMYMYMYVHLWVFFKVHGMQPWLASSHALAQLPIACKYLYCKRQEAGRGLENEAEPWSLPLWLQQLSL